MSSTTVRVHLRAPRSRVYRALVEAESVAAWMAPDGMRAEVHTFESREGGAFRISLTYEKPTRGGKTSADTDTYHGRFTRLVPDERVVQELEFEVEDPALQGTNTITMTLADRDGGTELTAVHEGLPSGIAPADNERGWRMSLAKLARLVEVPE